MKFNFRQMLKISAFYLKNKKVLFIKQFFFWAVVSKYANIRPKDVTSCPNFQWRFLCSYYDQCILPRSKTFLNPSHLFSMTCTRLSIRLSISSLSFLYLAEFSLSLLYKELCLLKISCNSFWRLGILSWSGNWAISWILMSNFSPHWIATNFNDKFLSTAWSAGVFLNLWKNYFRNLSLLQAHKKEMKKNQLWIIQLNSI